MVEDMVCVLYGVTLVGLAGFALHRLKLMGLYLLAARRHRSEEGPVESGKPLVCVQCPLFNEPLVVEALLEKVTALRWPRDLLEIQILDDSNDNTPEIIERWLFANPDRAACVSHVRRPNRQGYKAGALSHGQSLTKAGFLAVFDADFRPEPDFLEKLIPILPIPGLVWCRRVGNL